VGTQVPKRQKVRSRGRIEVNSGRCSKPPAGWSARARPVGPSPLGGVPSKPPLITDPPCAGLKRGIVLRSVRGFKSTCAVDAAQRDLPDFTGLLDQEVGRADGPEVPGGHGQNRQHWTVKMKGQGADSTDRPTALDNSTGWTTTRVRRLKCNGRVDPAHASPCGIHRLPRHRWYSRYSATDIRSLRDADCLCALFLPTLGPSGTRSFRRSFLGPYSVSPKR